MFILDDGVDVMVWIGLGASRQERKKGLNFGQEYLNKYNLPRDRCIMRLMEGGENEQFEAAFEAAVTSMARPEDEGVKFGGPLATALTCTAVRWSGIPFFWRGALGAVTLEHRTTKVV